MDCFINKGGDSKCVVIQGSLFHHESGLPQEFFQEKNWQLIKCVKANYIVLKIDNFLINSEKSYLGSKSSPLGGYPLEQSFESSSALYSFTLG